MGFAESLRALIAEDGPQMGVAFHRAFSDATRWSRVDFIDEGMPPSLSDVFSKGGAPFERIKPFLIVKPFLIERMVALLMSPHNPFQDLPLTRIWKGYVGFDERAELVSLVTKYVRRYEIG